jgi:hypothetical protein
MPTETAATCVDAEPQASKAITRSNVLLFAFTSFLSAFLLFQVQLIVSKHILPWFGGAASVWTTSMLVFQVLLLAGYLYSHLLSANLQPATQLKTHIALLGGAFSIVTILSLYWPSAVTPGAAWKPGAWSHPAASVATVILISVGLPFLVLSTTGPLLQFWFSRLGGDVKAYRLYSVSNVGSLLGLLTFPFMIEPALRLKTQGNIWSLLFCLFVVGCGICAWKARTDNSAESRDEIAWQSEADKTGTAAKMLWFALAACASSMLLATTNLLCQEVITVPLMWVLPLAIYLISFILCFDHPRWYQRAIFHPLFAAALFVTCASLAYDQMSTLLLALPALLFSACMVCHGELVRLRPHVAELTTFYLFISAGGAAGGIFVGVLAPLLFSSFLEFQISLAATIILLLLTTVIDRRSWIFSNEWWLPTAIVVTALFFSFGIAQWIPALAKVFEQLRIYPLAVLIAVITVMGAVLLRSSIDSSRRSFRFVQIPTILLSASGLVLVALSARPDPAQYLSTRSFYGVVQVLRKPGLKEMRHGMTTHGAQLDAPMQALPIMYYGPNSGIGVVLQNRPQRFTGAGMRIGVVGLGAGTIAAYGHRGDSISYYEINPDVVRLAAGDSPEFTYIRDSAASVNVKVGDARLVMDRELAEGHAQNFDVLALDAFNGDAIPVHLLTKEAFDIY